MEPSKKDFSPEQLKDLLWEIEQAPQSDESDSIAKDSASLAHSLGEELEEIPVFEEAPISSEDSEEKDQEPITTQEPPMENWLRAIADQKIKEIIQKQNLEGNINQILREVLPALSETIITREIEKIKEQIKGL